jgi:hypothetical protein
MPDTAPNTPNPTPVDIATLVAKHRTEIDRIKALSGDAQTTALAQYGFNTESMRAMAAALEPKAMELQQEATRAAKKTIFSGIATFLIAALTTFFTRKKVADRTLTRFLYVTLTSAASWIAGTWIGSRIFGKKVQEKSKAFGVEAQGVFDQTLALAIENTQQAAAAQTPDVQNVRAIIGKTIGQAAVELGIFSDEQRGRILEIKARFLALANAGQRLESGHGWDVLDDAKWQQAASAKGIGEEQLNVARKAVNEYKPSTKEQTPGFGDIAVALGFVSPDIKNILLTAQAAERTLQLTAPAGNTPSNSVADIVKDPRWQRIGGAGDAPYMQSAQAINYLGAMLNAADKEAGIPENMKDKINNARSALGTLSVAAFEAASAKLAAMPDEKTPALRLDTVAKDAAAKTGKGPGISREEAQRAVDILKAGLETAGQYITQKGAPWPTAEIDAKLTLARKGFEPPAAGLVSLPVPGNGGRYNP